ncbi:MAG TPA: thioredoxin domain-containing protein [Chitinophagaceae bacterium]|jgi:thiol-disulfide isomerase/thioredoxin|nr:thioredoxin domain-containing protein [Chitinophagaceae bacterium]
MNIHRKKFTIVKLQLLIAALLFSFSSYSQPKPLQIGDTLPTAAWQSLSCFRESQETGNRQLPTANRLLLLDFFATWCGSCYKRFPHLDSLQRELGDSLTVILVNTVSAREDAAKVVSFFTKRKNPIGLPYQFRFILNDSVFNKLFPHVLIPHYVWIYNDRFIAATGPEWITASNVRNVLSGIPVHWEIKNDSLQFEKRKRLTNK